MVYLNSFLLWGVLQGVQPAAIITGGIGFAYLKVLEKCFNDETGEVNLPGSWHDNFSL